MGSYSRAKYVTQSTDFPRSADSKSVSASYATFADLPASSTTIGNTAFVVATNKLYIWSGVGWYLVAEVTNASPSAISGVDGSYSLAIDGTATTITAVSTDPEGFALTWSYAVTSGSLAVTPAASAIAVVNNGSGAYTLSGGVTGDNSNVDIVVGQTVNFTVNASGHPFYIRDSNGGANVSSPAATGQGATSGVVSWTPNTAGTYYYQCGNHAAMVGTITVGAATVSATVAQADNVFTITPSTNTAAANTFSLTFNVTDGVNGSVSAVSAFTLSF
jgi:plastocyanin